MIPTLVPRFGKKDSSRICVTKLNFDQRMNISTNPSDEKWADHLNCRAGMVRDLPAALGELRLEGFQPFQPYKNLVLIRRVYSFAGNPNRTNSPERHTSEMSRKRVAQRFPHLGTIVPVSEPIFQCLENRFIPCCSWVKVGSVI